MDVAQQYRSPKQRYTLRDVYNAAKYEKSFNYAFWLNVTFDILGAQLMMCAGYCLVTMATALIAGISALGFLVVIPAITSPGSIAQWCHVIWGLFLVFCIYFNYFMAVLTKPGSPRECAVPQMVPAETVEQQEANDSLKLCKKCNYTKPKRTHHCSICNSCVMKMDHHCPWVSNCVGYRNYRYFVSFLFWVTLAVLYVACISGSKVFSSGSILFPGPGKPSLFHNLWGGKQRNIYSILYDMLSDSGEPRDSKVRRTPRSPRSTKRLRAHPKDAESDLPVPVTDAAEAPEHRRLPDVSNHSSADSPTYIDFKTMFTPPLQMEHGASASEKRSLGNVITTATEEFHEDHHAGRTSLHQQPDHAQWRQGSLLSWIAPNEVLIFLAFMTSMGVSFGTGMLLFLHMFLLSSGYTTIEYFESTEIMKHCQKNNIIYKHPYDRGFWANFAEVFGPLPWYLALLPSIREPPAAFYLVQEKCASGAGAGAGAGRSYGADPIESSVNGAQTSPVLRTSVSGGLPLWERNRTVELVDGNSDVENGGKAHSR